MSISQGARAVNISLQKIKKYEFDAKNATEALLKKLELWVFRTFIILKKALKRHRSIDSLNFWNYSVITNKTLYKSDVAPEGRIRYQRDNSWLQKTEKLVSLSSELFVLFILLKSGIENTILALVKEFKLWVFYTFKK